MVTTKIKKKMCFGKEVEQMNGLSQKTDTPVQLTGLQISNLMTATGLEPRTTQFLNEHSVWPNG